MYYLLHCTRQVSLHCLSHHQLHGSSHLLCGLLHLLLLCCWHRLRCTLRWNHRMRWWLRWWWEPWPRLLLCRCSLPWLPKTCNSRDCRGIEAAKNTIDATKKALDGSRKPCWQWCSCCKGLPSSLCCSTCGLRCSLGSLPGSDRRLVSSRLGHRGRAPNASHGHAW